MRSELSKAGCEEEEIMKISAAGQDSPSYLKQLKNWTSSLLIYIVYSQTMVFRHWKNRQHWHESLTNKKQIASIIAQLTGWRESRWQHRKGVLDRTWHLPGDEEMAQGI